MSPVSPSPVGKNRRAVFLLLICLALMVLGSVFDRKLLHRTMWDVDFLILGASFVAMVRRCFIAPRGNSRSNAKNWLEKWAHRMKWGNKEEESPEQKELRQRRLRASAIRVTRAHLPWHKLSDEDRQKAMDLLDRAENGNNNGDGENSWKSRGDAVRLFDKEKLHQWTHPPGTKVMSARQIKVAFLYLRFQNAIFRIRRFLGM